MKPVSPLLAGVRDTVPMLVGAAPFGLIFGTLAVGAGLSPAATLAMSAFVFAGSSQFVAVTLIGAGAAWPVIWMTTLVINLRHALYSAALLPYARAWPLSARLPLAFWLTDESYAVVEHRLRTGMAEGGMQYAFGSSLAMYGNWLLFSALGVMLGSELPGLADWGLDFAMLATFAAIVAPQLKNRPSLCAATAASAVALAGHGWPYKLDLMAAAAAGVAAGLWAESRQMPKKEEAEA
ncbi:AzlC family ABC transporter permease [Crenobacter cavernae]|uniref:Branched-chain amino acid ABC transporter permease n=1 Tax=Crenobacter cavernae TaxID=2290923 RepID=A0ABY0FDY2_9NEIS|nr:AzlC family ABC transporter permease [Crenobacter cavernae]RXZ44437.1 branched-chain amino acid ABC transporter permease [Crenobacter cavernae]